MDDSTLTSHSGENPDCLTLLKAFVSSDEGATAIEYGMIAAVISALLIGSTGSLRTSLLTLFNGIANSVTNAN